MYGYKMWCGKGYTCIILFIAYLVIESGHFWLLVYMCIIFLTGDPIFCLMDMGVWWPGFVLDVCANGVVSVAFWNENSM